MRIYLILLAMTFMASGCSRGFTPGEIESIKNEIKAKYEQRGWSNVEVTLIKDSNYHLMGNAKGMVEYNDPYSIVMGYPPRREEVRVTCTANRDVDKSNYIWNCK